MENIIVYKYRDWSNEWHRKILLENELYLSSPGSFNDPFDCKIPTNFYLLDTPEKKSQYADEYIDRNKGWLIKDGMTIGSKKEQILDRLNNSIESVQENNANWELQHNMDHVGVLSLTFSWNSILMWSHYAANHQGFCVGFYQEKLIESGFFGKGGDVEYDEKFPNISPLGGGGEKTINDSFIRTHHKALDWNYEQEYRLTKIFYPDLPTENDRKVNFKNDFIAEILLGLGISDEHKAIIIEIAQNKGVKVYQVTKVSFEFNLDRIQIA